MASACSIYGDDTPTPLGRSDAHDVDPDTATPEHPPAVPDANNATDAGTGILVDAKVGADASVVVDAGVPDRAGPSDVGGPIAEGSARDVDASPVDTGQGTPDAPLDTGGTADVGGSRDADSGSAPDAEAGTRDAGCVPTTSHDEDGDGVYDSCDNCPSVANANQADQGEISAGQAADGVGDACDPRPAASGDSILMFDPFTSGQVGPEWSLYAGTWTAGADTISETATGNSQEIDRVGFPSVSDYLVETQVTLDALPASDSRATLVSRMTTSSHNGWGCAVMNSGVLIFSAITGGEAGESDPPSVTIPTPQVGSRYRIQTGAYGSNLYCLLPGTTYRVNRTNTSYPTGAPGLRTYAGAATFEYMLVYRLGGPVP